MLDLLHVIYDNRVEYYSHYNDMNGTILTAIDAHFDIKCLFGDTLGRRYLAILSQKLKHDRFY